MVRLLCLHGTGTNSHIMKAQLVPLRKALPDHWEYVFPDAEIECDPAPGVESWPGPYYHYHLRPSVKVMAEVHEWLEDIIDSEGPFDGVFGFSAGGTVAASFMLQYHINKQELPFHFAIFCGSTLPWLATENFGIDLTPLIIRLKPLPVELSDLKAAVEAAKAVPLGLPSTMKEVYGPGIVKSVLQDPTTPKISEATLLKESCMLLHPDHDKIRLEIPTLHVLGRNDEFYENGKKLKQFFGNAEELQHAEGHTVPRGETMALKKHIEIMLLRMGLSF